MKRFFLAILFLSFFGYASDSFSYNTCSPGSVAHPTVPCTYNGVDYDFFSKFNIDYATVYCVSSRSYCYLYTEGVYYPINNDFNVVGPDVALICTQSPGFLLAYPNGTFSVSEANWSVGLGWFPWYDYYLPPKKQTLTITINPSGSGGVVITHPDTFEYQCGTEGQEECEFDDLPYNSQVTLEAQNNAGYAFSHWEINNQTMGDVDGEITVTMSEDKNVVAVFKLDYLVFPLSGSTPYNTSVSSVFDHSGDADYSDTDHQVIAFNGEASNVQTPYTGTTCYSKSDNSVFGSGFSYQGYGQAGAYYLCYNGHPGYDYAVSTGTNVYSAAPGKVIAAGNDSCLGYNVAIEHDAEYVTRYFHLNSIDTSNVQLDQDIPSGIRIGTSGDTGTCSDGPHLHFQVEKNGIPVDPYGWTGSGTDSYTRATNVTLWE